MYYRVDYVRNPWYDDHFDIPTERQRIGKTLTMIATPPNDLLSRGSLLIGWALYEKLDRVIKLMTQWLDDSSVSPVATASAVCTYIFSVSPSLLTYLHLYSTVSFITRGAGSGMAGMAAAIPIQNLVWRRHTNQK